MSQQSGFQQQPRQSFYWMYLKFTQNMIKPVKQDKYVQQMEINFSPQIYQEGRSLLSLLVQKAYIHESLSGQQ